MQLQKINSVFTLYFKKRRRSKKNYSISKKKKEKRNIKKDNKKIKFTLFQNKKKNEN